MKYYYSFLLNGVQMYLSTLTNYEEDFIHYMIDNEMDFSVDVISEWKPITKEEFKQAWQDHKPCRLQL